MQKALDISKHQNTFSPQAAMAAGISTVILRAAYGGTRDMRFEQFAAGCRAAGLRVGAYIFLTHHYYNKNKGSAEAARALLHEQIDGLLQTLQGQGVASWVALDQEMEAGQTMALAPEENTALLNEAAARLRAAGYAPCVYCSASWAKSRLAVDRLDCPLWLAYYYADPNDPDFEGCAALENLNTAWGEYTRGLGRKLCGWQFGRIGYGAKYGVGSANVDRDWIYFQPNEQEEELPVFLSDTLKIGPVSTGDRAAIRTLAESLCLPAVDAGDYIIVGPMSTGDLAAVAGKALALGLPCEDYAVPSAPEGDPDGGKQAEILAALERIEKNQAAQTEQLAALTEKLRAAGGALAGGKEDHPWTTAISFWRSRRPSWGCWARSARHSAGWAGWCWPGWAAWRWTGFPVPRRPCRRASGPAPGPAAASGTRRA